MAKRDLYLEKYYLKNFRDYLLSNQKSQRTFETYIDSTILFIEYIEQLDGTFNPLIITPIDIVDYINWSQTEKRLCISSLNIRIQSLKAYFQYLFLNKLIDINPAANIKKYKDTRIRKIRAFDEKTYRALRRVAYKKGPLTMCLFMVLCLTGLRISELLNLQVDDVKMNFNVEFSKTGKLCIFGIGKKYREVYLNREAKSAIANWMTLRTKKKIDSPYLFVSERRDKFSRSGISRIINQLYASIGVQDQFTVFSTRHYFCKSLLDKGVNPNY